MLDVQFFFSWIGSTIRPLHIWIKVYLNLIVKLHTQINSSLELNAEYIIN